jgi:hypothetical protein
VTARCRHALHLRNRSFIGVVALVFACLLALQRMLGAIAYAPCFLHPRARDLSFARQLAKQYFQRYPNDRYETEVESWRQIQSQNIEFTMKRRESIETPANG